MPLKLVNRFFGPSHLRHVEIAIDGGAVLPSGRKAADAQVDEVLLVPELVPRAKLHIGGSGDLEWPVAIGQFACMDFHSRKSFEMAPALQEETAPGIPAARVGINQRDVESRIVPSLAGPVRRRNDARLGRDCGRKSIGFLFLCVHRVSRILCRGGGEPVPISSEEETRRLRLPCER